MLPVVDHSDAVDDHRLDAVGILVWIVVGGLVGNHIRVKYDEIGGLALGDSATIASRDLTGNFRRFGLSGA